MESLESQYTSFLNVLESLEKKNQNPFLFPPFFNANNYNLNTNLFGFTEDLYDKEVRCPICLGRVKNALIPDTCVHVFCSYCIKRWRKTSQNCPICRKKFFNLLKVDLREEYIGFQGNIFV